MRARFGFLSVNAARAIRSTLASEHLVPGNRMFELNNARPFLAGKNGVVVLSEAMRMSRVGDPSGELCLGLFFDVLSENLQQSLAEIGRSVEARQLERLK